MTIYKTMGGMMVATAVAFSLALAGCGGQKTNSEPAEQEKTAEDAEAQEQTTTQRQTTTEQTTAESASTDKNSTGTTIPAEPQTEISEDEARLIALTDAGVTEADVTDLSIELDYDDDTGATVYDVSFNVGTTEYDYDIDPTSGAILRAESGVDD